MHALDGYDEISLTDKALSISKSGESIYGASDFGLESTDPKLIYGGDTIPEAGDILVSVLKNESTAAQKEVVLANTALALNCFEPQKSITECIEIARESIDSGKAYKVFTDVIEMSN